MLIYRFRLPPIVACSGPKGKCVSWLGLVTPWEYLFWRVFFFGASFLTTSLARRRWLEKAGFAATVGIARSIRSSAVLISASNAVQ
jgi:hypothetical protein